MQDSPEESKAEVPAGGSSPDPMQNGAAEPAPPATVGDAAPAQDNQPAGDAAPAQDNQSAGDAAPAQDNQPAGDAAPAQDGPPAGEAKPRPKLTPIDKLPATARARAAAVPAAPVPPPPAPVSPPAPPAPEAAPQAPPPLATSAAPPRPAPSSAPSPAAAPPAPPAQAAESVPPAPPTAPPRPAPPAAPAWPPVAPASIDATLSAELPPWSPPPWKAPHASAPATSASAEDKTEDYAATAQLTPIDKLPGTARGRVAPVPPSPVPPAPSPSPVPPPVAAAAAAPMTPAPLAAPLPAPPAPPPSAPPRPVQVPPAAPAASWPPAMASASVPPAPPRVPGRVPTSPAPATYPSPAPAPAGPPARPARARRHGRALRLGLPAGALVLVIVAAVLVTARPWQGSASGGRGASPSATARASQAPLAPVLSGVASNAPVPTEQAVAAALQPLITGHGLGSHVTVGVVDVSSGNQLYGSGEDEPTTPASTMKLATAVAVLSVRGPAYQMSTRAVAGEHPGEVVLIGGGDPTLAAGADAAYPGAAKLSDLAAQVKRALNGAAPTKVIVDSSLFTGPKANPLWDPSDVSDGQVSNITALMTDGGRTDPGHSGTSRYSSPDLAAGRAFATLLGLSTSDVSRGTAPTSTGTASAPSAAASGTPTIEPGTELGEVKSPPLVRIVETMLSTSDNVIAEMMARQVALATHQPASFAGGAAAVLATLGKLGIPTAGAHIVDGSGLSSTDKLTPHLLTAILTTAASPDQPQLRGLFTGLPVAGYSGTLSNRYHDDDSDSAAGMVRAKTGTLTGVNTLAGLVMDKSGRLLAFAVMADHTQGGAENALDKIAAALAGLG